MANNISTIASSSKKKGSATRPESSRRMMPAQREKYILEGAVSFFSEVGFSGQTRELSRRLGITQPLLYRYFSSKQVLIDRIYEHIFLKRWNTEWAAQIHNQDLPLRERLIEFYRQYSEASYQPEWIRIYIFAGLANTGLNQRYLDLVEHEILNALCIELRRYCGHSEIDTAVTAEEMEFAWSLHGGLFYYAVRHYIFGASVHVDFMANAILVIDNFLVGVKTSYPKLLVNLIKPAKKQKKSRPTSVVS